MAHKRVLSTSTYVYSICYIYEERDLHTCIVVYIYISKESEWGSFLFKEAEPLSFGSYAVFQWVQFVFSLCFQILFIKYGAALWNGEHTGVQTQGCRCDSHPAAYSLRDVKQDRINPSLPELYALLLCYMLN